MNSNCYAAVDLGASSGRIVVGFILDGKISLKEIHRFDNTQLRIDNHDCWDLITLEHEILTGLKKCSECGYAPKSIGIDTWGVDFVSLDKFGNILGTAIAYRDDRTKGIMDEEDIMTFSEIYSYAGIQKLQFNSIYQYIALMRENKILYDDTYKFLMIPDYLSYKLCGVMSNEYTNCSTTSMVNANSCDWDDIIFSAFGFDKNKHLKPEMPGKILGKTKPEVSNYIGYESNIVMVASHDTASAYLAVPSISDDSIYLSSGTWSLLGCENNHAITSDAARLSNFTNEGGYEKRFRFLKNIMGLWIIQCIRRELNGVDYVEGNDCSLIDLTEYLDDVQDKKYEFSDLICSAKNSSYFKTIIDVNDDRFLSPKNMTLEVINACKESNQEVPKTVGELLQCVYISLVNCYKKEISNLQSILGKQFRSINIVGGGCQDKYLNQLTANVCKLNVYAGPIEATSIGNVGVQMITDELFNSVESLRECIYNSFSIEKYLPQN